MKLDKQATRSLIRALILLIGVFIVTGLLIFFAQIKPIDFTLKTGEIKCDSEEECIQKAKEESLEGLSNQIQIKKIEFRRITSILRQFTFVPIEYEVYLKNYSTLKFVVTGTNYENVIKDISVDCKIEGQSYNLHYDGSVRIFESLELNDFQDNLFNQFDGCTLTQDQGLIHVNDKPFIWPSGESIIVSFERNLQFVPQLMIISKLLILLQAIIIILIALPILRQAGLFIKKGKKYFFET